MSVPNQKILKVGSRPARDREHPYGMINIQAMMFALKHLNGNAYKLWTYFDKNQDGYQFELSQKACEEAGIKRSTYYLAINELIEAGFLTPLKEGSNIFLFHEYPTAEYLDE